MDVLDDRTEHLINRKLDGELADGELLELQKALIRAPEARLLLEEYERNDALAAQTLRHLLRRQGNDSDPLAFSRPSGRWRRLLIALPIAAAIAILFLARPLLVGTTGPGRSLPLEPVAAGLGWPGKSATAAVIQGPRHENQRIQRDVLGVFDEQSNNLYVLELEQRQNKVTPVSMQY